MKIFLGADHNGFKLKQEIKKYLKEGGYDFEDLGSFIFDKTDDYPDFALRVAEKTVREKGKGILICGSGAGVCVAANKVKGVRAAQAFSQNQAKKQREDDNINVLCLASWEVKPGKAKRIVRTFLESKFKNLPRYKRRIEKIQRIEKKNLCGK